MKDKEYEVVEEIKGKDLVGLEYEPLYPYLENLSPESEIEKFKNAYKVYPADFVTTEDGTGIVHTAVMYGVDDFELGTKSRTSETPSCKRSGKIYKRNRFS